jgi:hypothetical protein
MLPVGTTFFADGEQSAMTCAVRFGFSELGALLCTTCS